MKVKQVWVLTHGTVIEGVFSSSELAKAKKREILDHYTYKVEPGFSYTQLNAQISISSYDIDS